MNAKAAISQALLNGHTLNVKNCFHLFGITNCSREMSRMIEKDFGVRITRTPREGQSKYGQPCTWFDYNLELSQSNAEGIKKMIDYITETKKRDTSGKTERQDKENKKFNQVTKYVQQAFL
jgi:hypothetical protein